jgi:L,D-transpeptidase catalytic domain
MHRERHITRRRMLCSGAAAVGGLLCAGWTKSRQLQFGVDPATMKPGDYTWSPERAPAGPVQIIVSLPEQRAYLYRGGVLMAVSTCSTGRKGHRTPTGVFTVLQMDKDHVSSTYKGAKMPYMERLTWSGIALHAGNLPNYPASHGCIRLPLEFAHRLFAVSHLGVVVIIADKSSEPEDVVHPGLLLPEHAEQEAREIVANASKKQLPPARRHQAKHRPAKIIVSVADRTISLLEDGHTRATGKAFIEDPGKPIGNHVFILKKKSADGTAFVWSATNYRSGTERPATASASAIIDRITTTRTMAEAVHKLMHPGLIFVITDAEAPDTTRSSRNFVIATHHEPSGWEAEVNPL